MCLFISYSIEGARFVMMGLWLLVSFRGLLVLLTTILPRSTSSLLERILFYRRNYEYKLYFILFALFSICCCCWELFCKVLIFNWPVASYMLSAELLPCAFPCMGGN